MTTNARFWLRCQRQAARCSGRGPGSALDEAVHVQAEECRGRLRNDSCHALRPSSHWVVVKSDFLQGTGERTSPASPTSHLLLLIRKSVLIGRIQAVENHSQSTGAFPGWERQNISPLP